MPTTRSLVLFLGLFLLVGSVAVVARNATEAGVVSDADDESLDADELYGSDETTPRSPDSSSDEADSADSDEPAGDFQDLYDGDSLGDLDDELSTQEDERQPYNCPSQCRCKFAKRNDTSAASRRTRPSSDDQDDVARRRRRRYDSAGAADDNDDLLNFSQQDMIDTDQSGDENAGVRKDKYDIDVDCSSQKLNTVRNLFDEDFPLDQIVAFNLSHNKFGVLRLDDGFEDLVNLRSLDVSSNPWLKSPSPKAFLRKFRHLKVVHLNDLGQIECLSDKSGRGEPVSLDCRWFRTIAYLHKRNITVRMGGGAASGCEPERLLRSSSVISKCESFLTPAIAPSAGAKADLGPLFSKSKALTLYQINSMRFGLKVEPEQDQLLIEGDRLELTCKLTRYGIRLDKTGRRKQRPTHARSQTSDELNFYRTKLRWLVNGLPLTSSPPSRMLDASANVTTVNIFLTKHKTKDENILESKLIVANVKPGANTGRYACVAANVMNDESRNWANGSTVDIKVIERQYFELGAPVNRLAFPPATTQDPRTGAATKPATAPKRHCPQIVTKTFKGTYTWPRSVEGTLVKLKCFYQATTDNATAAQFATYECLKGGRWSERLELADCQYVSNLTRFLYKISSQAQQSTTPDKNSQIYDLDQVIHQLVSIQATAPSQTPPTKLDAREASALVNIYDIIFMQRYLNAYFRSHGNRTLLSSTTRRQFMWLNDIMARVNALDLHRAQSLDAVTFSSYFFDCLLPILVKRSQMSASSSSSSSASSVKPKPKPADFEDDYYYDDFDAPAKEDLADLENASLLSSYLAAVTIGFKSKFSAAPSPHLDFLVKLDRRLVCQLNKYQLSQQLFFKCSIESDTKVNANASARFAARAATHFELDDKYVEHLVSNRTHDLMFILFDSAKLMPNRLAKNDSVQIFRYKSVNGVNGELDNFISELNDAGEQDDEGLAGEQGSQAECVSQVVSVVTSPTTGGLGTANASYQMSLTLEVKMPDVFYKLLGLIDFKLYNLTKENTLRNASSNATVLAPSDVEVKAIHANLFDAVFQTLGSPDEAKFARAAWPPLQLSEGARLGEMLQDPWTLRKLAADLAQRWLSADAYQVNYGRPATESFDGLNYTIIAWGGSNGIPVRCQLIGLEQNFRMNVFSPDDKLQPFVANDFRLFAKLSCTLENLSGAKPIEFICLKSTLASTATARDFLAQRNGSNALQMVNEFAKLAGISLLDSADGASFLGRAGLLFRTKYRLFKNNIVYFASATSCVLLVASILVYVTASRRLMMPRSFFHVYVNIWICMLALVLVFTFGGTQILIPHLCLLSAYLLHYLTLCAGVWYTLYFYSLFYKLNTLKKRNYKLIFENGGVGEEKEESPAGQQNGAAFRTKRLNDNFAQQDQDEQAGQGYVPRPVVHLYMLGWGVPLLLCAIIVSISKRDYIKTPFNTCFTNQMHIIVGSLLVPFATMFAVQLTLIVVTTLTLRRIVRHLEQDGGQEEDDEEEDRGARLKLSGDAKAEDRAVLCRNWNENNHNGDEEANVGAGGMYELKINPKTQRSILQTVSADTDAADAAKSYASSDSFERLSSVADLDRTSIMDTQYKPNLQLKYCLVCFGMFVLIWTLAACMVGNFVSGASASNGAEQRDFETKVFSYLFAVFLLVYSTMQITFYVLTREDLTLFEANSSREDKVSLDLRNRFRSLFGRRDGTDDVDAKQGLNRPEASADAIETLSNVPNYYFESKKLPIIQTASNSIDSGEEGGQIDDVYEAKVYERTGHNFLPKIETPTPEQLGEELDDDNDEHKKSICDVIFSSRKETGGCEQVRRSPSTCSLSSSNPEDGAKEPRQVNKFELNTSVSPHCNPTLAVQEEAEDLTIHSSTVVVVRQSNESTVYQRPRDLLATTPTTTAAKPNNSISNVTPPSQTGAKKGHHVRIPSLLGGSKEQNSQVLNGGLAEAATPTPVPLQRQHVDPNRRSITNSASKKPVYVYVDHKYEEKIYQKLVTSTSTTVPLSMAAAAVEQSPVYVSNRKSHELLAPEDRKPPKPAGKMNDLLWNKCTSHLGTAIDTLVSNEAASTNGAKSYLSASKSSDSSSGLLFNHHNFNHKTNGGLLSNACANSNGINSMTSSSVSSNLSSSNAHGINSNHTGATNSREMLNSAGSGSVDDDDDNIYQLTQINSSKNRPPPWSSATVNSANKATTLKPRTTSFGSYASPSSISSSNTLPYKKATFGNSNGEGSGETALLLKPSTLLGFGKHETSV